MKPKNKIINTAPKVSSEELESYMDFDNILENFQKGGGYAYKTAGTTKVIVGIVSAVLIIGIAYYFSVTADIKESTIEIVEEELTETSNKDQIADVPVIVDDSSSEPENATISVKEKQATTKQKPKTKPIGEKEAKVSEPIVENNNTHENEEKAEAPVEPSYSYLEASPLEGMPYLYAYFEQNLTYPEALKKDSIEGIVLIQFAILKDSAVANISIIKSLGEQFDQEAIRVISNMPKWKPATVNDVPVSSRLSIPLTFTIKK